MLRSMMKVSGLTAVSRLLGFLRDILIGSFLGTGAAADAWVAAFRFPNMFRRIFGEGAFNAAFVPLFGRKLEQDGREPALRFANNAFSTLTLVLGFLTVVAIPAMPWLMGVVVPGFKARMDKDLSRVAEVHSFEPLSFGTVGARDIYFVVEARTPEARRHWAERIVIEDLRFRQSARDVGWWEHIRGRLFGADPEALRDKPVTPQAFQLSGLHEEADGFVIGPDGTGRIDLPRRHAFLRLEAQVKVRPARPNEEVPQGRLRVFRNHPQTFDLTVFLTRITFCYLLFMALTAHMSGVLNTFKIFGVPAAAPIILNLAFLAGLGLIWWRGWDSDWWKGTTLAWSVAIAGFLQFAALWVTCRSRGAPVGLVRPRLNPDLRRLFLLMGPGIVAAGIQQINLLVGGIIASFQEGAVSYLYYSERIYQLPLGMIGIALGVVLLPEVTRKLRGGHEGEAARSIVSGIELALLLTIPAAVAMLVIPTPLVAALFERNEFTAESSRQTGAALAGFALGLPGYVLIKVLQPGYFAREDTKSPMIMAGITVLVNIVVSLILFPFLRHVGIAIATSVAAWVNVILLWRGLRGFVKLRPTDRRKIRRMVAASLLMGAAVGAGWFGLAGWVDGNQLRRLAAIGLLVGLGASLYGFLALTLKATSLAELKESLGKE